MDVLFHPIGPGLVSQRRAQSQKLRGDDNKYIERERGAQYTTDPATGDLSFSTASQVEPLGIFIISYVVF